MNQQIHDANEHFPFAQLSVTSPILVTGGNYFVKFQLQGSPLYIQLPKCAPRQGIIKGGKKMYCDLLFTNENEEFIRWIEELETYAQQQLFEHRAKWFETELDKHDIENSFTSSLKLFKSGKYYVLRTNVPTRLGKCALKLFDESETDVDAATLNENMQVVTIVEVQGIKCSSRTFQLEFECKQMMVIKADNLFERCIIRTGYSPPSLDASATKTVATASPVVDAQAEDVAQDVAEDVAEDVAQDVAEDKDESPIAESLGTSDVEGGKEPTPAIQDVTEVDVTVNDQEVVQLRPRNEIYYELYYQAIQKAKEARKTALHMYLEAKQIKELYKLDVLDEEDDDDDKHKTD